MTFVSLQDTKICYCVTGQKPDRTYLLSHSALVCMSFSLISLLQLPSQRAHPCGLVPIISSSASFAISFLVMPRYFLRIYSLSCPRVGAGLRILIGVRDNFTGKPG